MVIVIPVMFAVVAFLPQEPHWYTVIPAAIGCFIFIAVTMGIIYRSLPDSIAKYWRDDYTE